MSLASFNALVDRIYAVSANAEGWSGLVPDLEAQLGGRVAIFAQRETSVSTISACSKGTPEAVSEYERRLWPEDRAMQRLRGAAPDEIVIDSDLISSDERSRSSFYGQYLPALGLEQGIYASVLREGGENFVVSVQRGRQNPRFTAAHAEMLRTLSPHFARSLRIWRAVQRERQERDAALKAARRSKVGLVLADRNAIVHFANEIARQVLSEGVLKLAAGRLHAASAEGRAILSEALSHAVGVGAPAERAIVIPSGAAGEALSLSVGPAEGAGQSGYGSLAVIVMAGDGEPAAIDPLAARAAFGLTDAEARLLAALVSGKRLGVYASTSGISLTTAKTHLRSLFDKTGERRQADLIRRALATPALRLPHDE